MKIKLLIISLLFAVTISAQDFKKIKNTAFDTGEKLSFKIAFSSMLTGNITAGNATMEVMPQKKTLNNRNTYHVVAKGSTSGFVEFFYKVNDKYETFIDDEAFVPLKSTSRIRENNYKRDDTVYFNHKEQIAKRKLKRTKISANSQDMLSAFYYARTQNISNLKQGDYLQIPFLLNDSLYVSKVVFSGKETIKTKKGTFNCVVFKPMVATGKMFDESYPVTMWLTDDNKRLPILIEMKLSVGKMRIELIDSLVKK